MNIELINTDTHETFLGRRQETENDKTSSKKTYN